MKFAAGRVRLSLLEPCLHLNGGTVASWCGDAGLWRLCGVLHVVWWGVW
jgi:hypothetical protein